VRLVPTFGGSHSTSIAAFAPLPIAVVPRRVTDPDILLIMLNQTLSVSVRKDPVTWLYPPIEPYNTGRLKVSDLQEIYFEESGSPSGKPVVFLEAETIASTTLDRALPEGIHSRDNFLLAAKAKNENILVTAEHPRKAYLYDLIVEDPYRGRGLDAKSCFFSKPK